MYSHQQLHELGSQEEDWGCMGETTREEQDQDTLLIKAQSLLFESELKKGGDPSHTMSGSSLLYQNLLRKPSSASQQVVDSWKKLQM